MPPLAIAATARVCTVQDPKPCLQQTPPQEIATAVELATMPVMEFRYLRHSPLLQMQLLLRRHRHRRPAD
ncbi:hypothetical protein E2562_010001 [Oryza meyeriana var. granulata]|uniref:Uncharacterized protein n=1 Tax=Oryza meyeriana var. granulata TaxID=110450 RepID=A0A6G1EHZ0_9ORYZ|nr:hypothetical protein E2562_010001 [Oryza meyeriana var. granulata]